MSKWAAYAWSIVVLLAAVAAMSRVLTMKDAGSYVSNGFTAVSNLFKGAFGQ